MSSTTDYRGRFAPSPTGPLHFGSLVAALGSYLDARHHNGSWLVRMEDLDTPRTVAGAADLILHTLENFGLHWDEAVLYQSSRTPAYDAAFQHLQSMDTVYPCSCTRKEIADSAIQGQMNKVTDELIYPGTCRHGIPAGREARAWRVLVGSRQVSFGDELHGCITQNLASEIGDFVVKRADGLFAYQLAVVVDDAYQGINHVVRGADLINSTPRQVHLQHLLVLPTPHYLHLPVAVNQQGEKLSKQTLARAIDNSRPAYLLLQALEFLQQHPPAELAEYDVTSILDWAIKHWNRQTLKGIQQTEYI